ncbi:MAG: hypothetical protein J5701_01900 [Bacteroidales bacterium]|nr:hypothetical protein [Bacteroidales bacterium]
MKVRLVPIMLFTVIAAVVLSACEKQSPKEPNVYIAIADNGKHHDFALMLLTYVPVGDNAYTGKNILGKSKGTIEFKGLTYECFSIPKGVWDLYFEYSMNDEYYDKFDNERKTINLRDNDWVRISWDLAESYAAQPGIIQGSGSLY